MEYRIVRRDTIALLVTAVEARIAQGWRPQGGVLIATTRRGPDIVLQAMVRGTAP
jgi:hypothetical protein